MKKLYLLLLLAIYGCSQPVEQLPAKPTVDTVFVEVEKFNPRQCVANTALEYLGVTEATGKNDGPEVEAFLSVTGLGPGYAWCASYMSFVFNECEVEAPISAWSPDWSNAGEVIWQQGDLPSKARLLVKRSDHFTIYYNSKGRVGHVGLVIRAGATLTTIEGNTNIQGSREGDGVYIKQRPYSMVYKINRLIHD